MTSSLTRSCERYWSLNLKSRQSTTPRNHTEPSSLPQRTGRQGWRTWATLASLTVCCNASPTPPTSKPTVSKKCIPKTALMPPTISCSLSLVTSETEALSRTSSAQSILSKQSIGTHFAHSAWWKCISGQSLRRKSEGLNSCIRWQL